MKKVIVSLVSAAALATVGMAAASNSMAASDQSFSSSPSTSSGVYVNANLGYGKVNTQKPAGKNVGNTAFSWNGNLGYQFARYFAIETGYTMFPNVTSSFPGFNSKEKTYGIDLLAKGILPINSQFDVFAKAGAMYIHSNFTTSSAPSTSGHTYVPEFAAGTDYYVTKNVDVSLEGVATLGVKSGTHTMSMPQTYAAYAGLGYKFSV